MCKQCNKGLVTYTAETSDIGEAIGVTFCSCSEGLALRDRKINEQMRVVEREKEKLRKMIDDPGVSGLKLR